MTTNKEHVTIEHEADELDITEAEHQGELIEAAGLSEADLLQPLGASDESQEELLVITTSTLRPGDQNAITRMVLDAPKGKKFAFGTVQGWVSHCERREGQLKDSTGKLQQSIWLKGDFEAVSFITGEVTRAPYAILPVAVGQAVENAFEQGAVRIILDLQIGVKATGAQIPYRWYAISFGASDRGDEVMKELRKARQRRLEHEGMKALTHTAKASGGDPSQS